MPDKDLTVEETLARLLRLLATEAPDEAFHGLAEAVEARAPGPGRETLLHALRQGAVVRTRLQRRRRREKETQALLETARGLAALRDVDEALEAIVGRTRQLLGTDATYLALVDPERGDVYMRITLGTVTRAIESVRQPKGSGVGGLIVATGEPFATRDYLADPRISRDPSVADAVVQDGIVSMAGVPMRLGAEVIGALFVANRHERTFERDEIALLSALADHASIVIENARLFGDAEATAHRLREANDELARHGDALERAGAAHERLIPMALRRADLADLVDTVAEMLEAGVAAVDPEGVVLAAATRPGHPGSLPDRAPDVAAGIAPDAAGTVRLDATTWAAPIRAGGERFGHLVLHVEGPVPSTDVRILERAAQTAALLQLMEQQVSLTEQRLRGEVVEELLAEREPDWAALERRARRAGPRALDLHRPHTVVVMTADDAGRRSLLRAASAQAARRGGIALEHGAHVVVLLPGVDPAVAAREVPEQLSRATSGRVTAGVAGPAASGRALRAAHREADRCHRLLIALGREGQGATTDELGALGLILDGTSRAQVRALLAQTVAPLLRYDAEHGAELLRTLDGYFAAGQNPRAAAKALQLHPNTVYQRMERIDRVLGHRRWREPDGSLSVQVALQLHRILDHIPLDDLVPG
ncbi:GAF domain-containing protein [Pseudonocardia sp. RS11V-5]|uniref:helix-turn-helix domain-containing protein n=1 Tax=Pseudonocardia terrae TaxID=2905831 RepID=UPI001E428055|nr:GAF domain-containing protein [Pseudonocardia terrae]MCE3553673.1 GAF domain-containing protein [Pseudonocardia terrae]